MSVDLAKLPVDEGRARKIAGDLDAYRHVLSAAAIHNVLDALNFYRCKAIFAEQELARANSLLIETRNSAEHNRIFGSRS